MIGNPLRASPLILVVEDDLQLRQFVQRTLKRWGYRSLLAGSSEEALRVSAECPESIAVLIQDIMLPDSWGTRLAQDLRSQHPELRLILMSGYAESDPILAAGIHSRDAEIPFLEKPFSPEELVEALNTVLGLD